MNFVPNYSQYMYDLIKDREMRDKIKEIIRDTGLSDGEKADKIAELDVNLLPNLSRYIYDLIKGRELRDKIKEIIRDTGLSDEEKADKIAKLKMGDRFLNDGIVLYGK